MISTRLAAGRACLWRRVRRNHLAVAGSVIIAVIAVAALLAPVLPLAPPNVVSLGDRLKPVLSSGHVLGTDDLGRDMLSRLVWGARVSLPAGLAATLIAAGVGVGLGLLAGYFGNWSDQLLMRATDMFMAFPTILLALAVIAVLGPSVLNAVVALGFAGFPVYARTVRGLLLTLREQEFVAAARVVGAPAWLIIVRHLLPNSVTPIIVVASLDVGNMSVLASGLSFLGLGTQPPMADWGTMLAAGRNFISTAPHVATLPGLVIFVAVFSFNLIGDGLRDMLDPRTVLL